MLIMWPDTIIDSHHNDGDSPPLPGVLFVEVVRTLRSRTMKNDSLTIARCQLDSSWYTYRNISEGLK